MVTYIIVYCTCPDENSAQAIASKLIQAKIAACVSLIPAVRSYYWWQGKVEQACEVQLQIKSKKDCFEQITQLVRSIHPYEVPQIIAVPIEAGDKDYLTWIDNTVT